ncbi:MAG: XisI protein [Bacteroidota bacterium]
MDNKLKKYKQIVSEVLDEVGLPGLKPDDPIQTQFIKDHESGHYLLFSAGWKGKKRIYGCFLHIDVMENGRVWLQHDGTDLVVGQMLLDKGILKQDLVLGFLHPNRRKDTEYAVT